MVKVYHLRQRTGALLLQLCSLPEGGWQQAVREAAAVDRRHALVLLCHVELAEGALADVDAHGAWCPILRCGMTRDMSGRMRETEVV